jgi:hypothetical protein
MTSLNPGQTVTVPIDSRLKWNDTGVLLRAGARYEFSATGTWHDRQYATDADGYPSSTLLLKLAEPLRRVRSANWFTLIGAIDRDERSAFRMGSKGVFSAAKDGQLTCFANDTPLTYGNNSGSVSLTVTRRS